MTDRDEENARPENPPLFTGSLATRGRTYVQARPKKSSRSSRSISSSVTNKRRKTSKGRRSLTGRHRSNIDTKGTPRCALQTLGGSRKAGPLKGGLSNSNEATLKKMRGYGGKLFYDKCYLSSDDDDDDDGAGLGSAEQAFPAWALSPPSDGDDARPSFTGGGGGDGGGAKDKNTKSKKGETGATKNVKKGTAKGTAAAPPPAFKPLPLSSLNRRGRRSGVGSGHRRRQNEYDLGACSGEDGDAGDGDGDSDSESSEEEWEMGTTASTNGVSTARARRGPAAASARDGGKAKAKAVGKTMTEAKPSARGDTATNAVTAVRSPPVRKKPRAKAPAAACSSAGAGGGSPVRRPALLSASRGKGRIAITTRKGKGLSS